MFLLFQYSYEAEIGQVQASLTVLWNGDTFIDKTNGKIFLCKIALISTHVFSVK